MYHTAIHRADHVASELKWRRNRRLFWTLKIGMAAAEGAEGGPPRLNGLDFSFRSLHGLLQDVPETTVHALVEDCRRAFGESGY
jgi:hypothetical protein